MKRTVDLKDISRRVDNLEQSDLSYFIAGIYDDDDDAEAIRQRLDDLESDLEIMAGELETLLDILRDRQ